MKTALPLYEIAQLFQSADAPHTRLLRALELLKELVPYHRCALLDAQPARDRRVLLVPPLTGEERAALERTLDEVLGLVSEHHDPIVSGADEAEARERGPYPAHLAVPLVGLDCVIGVLFVGRAAPRYQERELRLLSVVASQIATYLTMLRLNDEKDEFLAMLSHELRSPLSAVLGWTKLLTSGAVPEEGRARALLAITRSAGALGSQIEDLVDLSRIRTGKLRLDLARVEPTRVVEAAVEAARFQAEAKSIRVELVPHGREGPVLADAERLRQIVANLLSNAIKFTPEGGRVEVQVEHEGDRVSIRVSDTGIGIPADSPAPDLQSLPPGKPVEPARAGRPRPGARHRAQPGRAPRRADPGREPRGGSGRDHDRGPPARRGRDGGVGAARAV